MQGETAASLGMATSDSWNVFRLPLFARWGQGRKSYCSGGDGGGIREGEGMCQVSPEVRGSSDNANKGVGGIGVRSGAEGL